MEGTPVEGKPVENLVKSKRLLISIVLIFIVLLLGLVAFLYLNNQKPKETTTQPMPSSPAVVVSEAKVSISKDGFLPTTISIKKGSQVTWTNQDTNPHQVASDPHPTHTDLKGLESDPLVTNESFTFTFEKTGTFTYHDHLYPLKFRGTVIVN